MMSLTREIGHQNTKLDRGKGEIGDGSVSIHTAREKTPPPKKRALYTAMERDRARDGAVESALRRLTVFSSSVNASSVVKAILDSHSFFWGDFQREKTTQDTDARLSAYRPHRRPLGQCSWTQAAHRRHASRPW